MNFLIYIVGFMLFLGGLVWLAITMGAPQQFVMIGAVIVAGIGIMSAVVRTRRRTGTAATDVTVVK